MSTRPQLAGRSSSHFTRVARIFAHEFGVDLELLPVHDITATDAAFWSSSGVQTLRSRPLPRSST